MSYKQYYLQRNPFSTERHDYPIVGRAGVLSELKYSLSRMIDGGGPHFIMIKGGYGIGKTRILFELVNRLRPLKSDFIGERRVSMTDRPIRTLPARPPAAYLSRYLLPEIFRRLGRKNLAVLRQELDALSTQRSEDATSILERINVDRHLLQTFLALNTEHDEIAWRWFLGETLSPSERRALGNVQRIAREDMAERILVDFLKILAILDYKALILPLDEFEYVGVQSRARRISLVEVFRSLYDRVVEELTIVNEVAALIIVLAITPDGWDGIQRFAEAEAFIDRVRRDNVIMELGPFDEDHVREFIQKRLEKDRLPDSPIPQPLFPFGDNCSHLISDHSGGKPRVISSYCYIILDEGIRQNKETITATFADGVLRDRGFVIEAIPSEKL